MAQVFLNDPQMNAFFQKMRGIRMAQGMHRSPLMKAAFSEGGFEDDLYRGSW